MLNVDRSFPSPVLSAVKSCQYTFASYSLLCYHRNFMSNFYQQTFFWTSTIQRNHPHHCLLNRLLRRRSKKTWKLHVTGLCAGISPVTGKCFHLMTSSYCFCEARRASHCHSPQTTYSSKSTCCAISAQNSAMHVVVYAGRLTSQRSIVEIINWKLSYWQI